MPKYERLQDGVVVDLVDLPGPIEGLYHPDIAALYQPAGDGAQAGWRKAGDSYLPPAPLSVDLYAYAADKRWRVETAGITVADVPVATDRESQSLITGAHAYVQINPGMTIKYKSGAGFVDLDAATVTAVATAIAAHVQACFAAEADVSAAIADGSITTIQQIDDWPWPA